jgi:predicted tellurium resistance membrane protein TerC
MTLTTPLFGIFGHEVSGRDLILLVGGLFLLGKATVEIHDKLEGADEHGHAFRQRSSFASIIAQIAVIDIVFSLDSVITAVGMAQQLWVMVVAVVVAVLVMMVFAGVISGFIERHPTLKVLALSFMILIGVMLIVEGWGKHVDRGYLYFAMVFSLGVEVLNMRMRKKGKPVHLKQTFVTNPDGPVS